ncbi:MAG TPA: hypothetical protein VJ930_02695 [Acidimicrobiia bacterium]|nr:hypothetical protein [Acidimicrobiia bacterium]
MPRSSPSTSPAKGDGRIVEVVELDRDAYDPGLPTLGNRPNRWAILLGIVVLGVLGLSLLPAAEVQPNSLDDTLPDPAVATTLVGSRQPRVAFINDETFPMFVVSGLRGFASLTEPVLFDGKWWIIGNPPGSAAAVALSSEDGRLWEASSEIADDNGMSIRIDQLTVLDESLVAVGTQGTWIGPAFFPILSGELGLWRSGDGERWVPEMVTAGNSSVAFTDAHLVTSGRSTLLQVLAQSTASHRAASRLPAYLHEDLEAGRFFLQPQGTRLVVYGPLSIYVDETALTEVASEPTAHLFRSEGFASWVEIDIQFNMSGEIVAAPEGGFVVGTGGVAFTSAYGVNWSPNAQAYDADFFQDWGEGILGLRYQNGNPVLSLIDSEGQRAVQLQQEMTYCLVNGSNSLLAASCLDPEIPTARNVPFQEFELSLNDYTWLQMHDPSTGEDRNFRLQRGIAAGYDPDLQTITLADSQGRLEVFPIAVLEQLASPDPIISHETMLSKDGLTWSRSQIALRATELELLGGIGDGFLVATRSSEPGSTLTVLAADF